MVVTRSRSARARTNKTSGKLTNKLSSLTLNVGLDVNEGGTFVNNGTIEASKAITVDGSLVNTGTLKTNADLTVNGGFDNAKGKIEVTGTDTKNKANVTINGLNKTDDLEAAPASVVMATSRSRTPPSRTRTRATSSRPKPTRRKAKTTRRPKRALA